MTTTVSVKMADDSDIPPLEDMTDVLQKAELIREKKQASQGQGQTEKTTPKEDVKKRAKVTKKPIKNNEAAATAAENTLSNHEKLEKKDEEKAKATTKPSGSSSSQGGMFGGMKKGFLFGGPSPSKPSPKPASSTTNVKQRGNETSKTPISPAAKTAPPTEDIPFISPSSKPQSNLNLNEVQQAMSEAKGLLDNQEWITDDFLTKIEKNETLLKRFSDAKFMSALQEFQSNPQAAMAKYKGNTEVETFLMEFCGMLGDHFQNLGDSDKNPQSSQKPPTQTSNTVASKSKAPSESLPATTTPKIVEIGNGDETELKTIKPSTTSSSKLKTVPDPGIKSESPHIRLHDPQNGADIQELPSDNQGMPQTDDQAVKDVLNDPKVMETLMDPKIMALIKVLREDPEKGQRLIDKADLDLKEKVRFLVTRGLLQFQMS